MSGRRLFHLCQSFERRWRGLNPPKSSQIPISCLTVNLASLQSPKRSTGPTGHPGHPGPVLSQDAIPSASRIWAKDDSGDDLPIGLFDAWT